MENRQKKHWIMFVAFCAIVISLLAWVISDTFVRDNNDEPIVPEQNIPSGVAIEMEESKSTAYREKHDSYHDLMESLAVDDNEISLVSGSNISTADVSKQEKSKNHDDSGHSAAERVFGTPPEVKKPQYSTQTARRTTSAPTSDERLEYERKRAEMVRDVILGEEPVSEESKNKPEPNQRIHFSTDDDDIISSLDDDIYTSDSSDSDSVRPFRCMFVRNQKLSSGQRITVRLIEDYSDGSILIPANTHLSAICDISDRLELSITSFEMKGRIIPLNLEAYDIDGIKGIYCPETALGKNAKTASDDAINTANSTLGGLVGNIASTILRTGAKIARSASGEISVEVVSGYEFYLVKNTRK